MNDSEIVLFQQADEIISSLPSEMQNNPDVSDFVIEALQNKIDKIDIRTTALEIGQEQLKQAMAHGFSLVNDKFVAMQHEQEKDRIHAEYARKDALEAKNFAQQAWQKAQELGISVVRAEERAEGAKDLAKQSRFLGFDPLTGMAVCAIGIIGAMILMSLRVEKVEPSRARSEPASYPPTYDCSNSVSNGLTTDFSKCRKVGGV
jgi:topoisomerase IA-like protein